MPVLFALVVVATPGSIYDVDLGRDLGITAAFAVAATVPFALTDKLIEPSCPCDRRDVNAFDRFAIDQRAAAAYGVSNLTVGVAVAAPLVADLAIVGWSRTLLDDAVIYAQTLAVTGTLVSLTKVLVARPFPHTYAGDRGMVDKASGYLSFYSGHTVFAATALSAGAFTGTMRRQGGPWPWIVAVFVTASVATELVVSGEHFPTDVLVGAAVGGAVGVGIPALHLHGDAAVTLVPSARGFALRATF